MIKTAIVGYGKMGKVRHKTLTNDARYALKMVCEPGNVEGLEPSIRHIQDFNEVLKSDLDAVFICTPNDLVSAYVTAALDRGFHVFSEKPAGRNLQEIGQIREAEARHPELKLKFGFNHRYHGSIQEAYRLVQSGRMGRVLWARGIYGKSGGQGFEQIWRSQKEIAGGGILLDQGIHMADLLRLFCGEFEEVKSMVNQSFWNISVEDNAFALLRNSRNQIAMLHSSSTHWKHRFSLEIFLTEGYLTVNGILSGTRSYGRETLVIGKRQFDVPAEMLAHPREEVIHFDEDTSWQQEAAEFADCIISNKPIQIGNSQDAYKTMELVMRIYEDDRSASGERSKDEVLFKSGKGEPL